MARARPVPHSGRRRGDTVARARPTGQRPAPRAGRGRHPFRIAPGTVAVLRRVLGLRRLVLVLVGQPRAVPGVPQLSGHQTGDKGGPSASRADDRGPDPGQLRGIPVGSGLRRLHRARPLADPPWNLVAGALRHGDGRWHVRGDRTPPGDDPRPGRSLAPGGWPVPPANPGGGDDRDAAVSVAHPDGRRQHAVVRPHPGEMGTVAARAGHPAGRRARRGAGGGAPRIVAAGPSRRRPAPGRRRRGPGPIDPAHRPSTTALCACTCGSRVGGWTPRASTRPPGRPPLHLPRPDWNDDNS